MVFSLTCLNEIVKNTYILIKLVRVYGYFLNKTVKELTRNKDFQTLFERAYHKAFTIRSIFDNTFPKIFDG